jgi:RNA processing factor Prp31
LNFSKELGALKKYLNEDNKVANKQGKDLTNFEVLKDRSQELAEERQRIEEYIKTEFKLPIKSQILKLVNQQKPSLRGAVGDDGAYDGIEGVIFTDPKTREKFKVVDREVFTRINQFNYQVRKGIASRTITTNPEMPKEQRGGIVGEARLRAINMFGLSNAELPNQAKKVLANFKGTDREETVKNIVKSLHQLNFEAVKRKIQSIYVSALDDLDEALDAFKTGADEYILELENGKKIKYTQEIKRRTLMTFAEAHKTLIEMLARLRKAGDMAQLIEIFFGKQLDDLHGGSSV